MSDAETTPATGRVMRSDASTTERNETDGRSAGHELNQTHETVRRTDHERDQATRNDRECTTCPECNGTLIEDAEHGETMCRECGLIVEEDAIDHGPEWRSFNNDGWSEKRRTGAPSTERIHDNGLATRIGWEDRDANGNMLNSRQRQRMSRLRTWDNRYQAKSGTERNLRAGLTEIERMASALGISDTARETASVIFQRAQEERLLIGRSIEGVATASLYAAARMANLPRTLGDVAHVSRIDQLPFERAYRCILKELELAIEPADPFEFLPQFLDQLNVAHSGEFEQTARELLEDGLEDDPMSGKSPSGLAASALYAASIVMDEPVTQDHLSEISDTSNVTIRNGYQLLLDSWRDESDIQGC